MGRDGPRGHRAGQGDALLLPAGELVRHAIAEPREADERQALADARHPTGTAAAEPATGDAPLDVAFDAEATDAEGEALTYAWDFGVSGTTADTSTEEDPAYTYENPGNYTATVTVTDASGGRASSVRRLW